jgi:hypothetical protein
VEAPELDAAVSRRDGQLQRIARVIYASPIESISWDDVQAFCAQDIAENAFLDYKADFPNDLARTIAAMMSSNRATSVTGPTAPPAFEP